MDELRRAVERREPRKLAARNRPGRPAWFGLGMFGLVGWSVALPAVLGALLGAWIDRRMHAAHSWTLMLLALGLGLGCANAWRWIRKEQDWR